MEEPKPGQVIIPHDAEPEVAPASSPEKVAQDSPIDASAASSADAEAAPAGQAQEQQPAAQQISEAPAAEPTDANWQFSQEDTGSGASNLPPLPEDIRWTAAEFIAHDKTATWYLTLATAGLAAAALLYWITKDKITTGTTLFAVVAFAAFAGRKPKSQNYAVTGEGVQVGTKIYDFQNFKNYSVIEEGTVVSIAFMPLKRFMPALTIYVAPDAEQGVVDFLSAFLPYQEHKPDAVDNMLRRIRF